MRSLLLFASGAALYLVSALWASARARRELLSNHAISRATFGAAVFAYASLWSAVLLGALWSAWSLPIPTLASRVLGGAFAILGMTLHLAGRSKFHTVGTAWGLSMPSLITTGIYRYIRHPQNAGLGLLMLSAAVLGRSGAALALVLIYAATCVLWLRVEELALATRFGPDYYEYRKTTGAVLPPLRRLLPSRRRIARQPNTGDGEASL
ncbi:MAG TPA: isoprenylcysteine carboxylmethyltransferase family protein [Candidatus Polarisedimenticolia bacterium]|nr:isoprenylcysteine carboxylmethyltransferase family protein [Candidatus Polarisedimenticolia bacterium]